MPGQIADIEESLSQLSILTVPFEVIEQILNYVPTSKDILNFALASKNCYAHAVPVLYRNVDWVLGHKKSRKRTAAMPSLAFLLAHPDLLTVTRSLRVSEKKYAVGGDTKLCIDNPHDESPSRPTDMKNFELNTAHNNYPQMFHTTTTVLSVLPRFTGLTELILRSITLPRTFYQSVHALSDSNLRRLTLRYCRLTSRYPRGYDPATLRLTELTIFHIYARLPKLKALLKLSWSTTLRTLRLDRSTELALGSLAAHGLPSSVRAVELDFRGPAAAGRRMLEYLFPFLNSCKHVQHLELADMGKLDAIGQYPFHKRLAVNALPSLTSIAVPTVYLDLLLFGRAIDSLTITDTTNRDPSHMAPIARFLTVDGVAEVLRILRGASISLQSLKFNLKTWDKELFYMLAAKQSQLKELHVTYQYGEPDDDFFMSLGNLIEFPHLERLHLYRFGDKMAGSDDSRFVDHKEYAIIWQLYMPNLCEVALASDVMWFRSPSPSKPVPRNSKPTWSRYAVKPMDGVNGLVLTPCPKEAKSYEAYNEQQRRVSFHRLAHGHTLYHNMDMVVNGGLFGDGSELEEFEEHLEAIPHDGDISD